MRRRERILGHLKRARKYRGVPMQLIDIVRHKVLLNTYWEDYYRYQLYRDEIPWEERSLYVGYFGSRYYPWEMNSLKFDELFLRKSLQKALLTGHGLPTPRMVAKVGLDYEIDTKEKFRALMDDIDRPVVSKFDGGGSGARIFCLVPESGKFRCAGKLVDVDWIWSQYAAVIDKGFLLEEQAENHESISAVYPHSLNTLRMTTIRTADGTWHLRLPFIKFGQSGSQVDNISAGGLFAGIDEAGRAGLLHSSKSFESLECHPDTGHRVQGMEVPFFTEARELALRASNAVGFLRTIAWDVAITPGGPTIIEGNHFWDCRNTQEHLGPFLTPEIAAGLRARSWWTPWDKSHLFPRYQNVIHDDSLANRFRRHWPW